MSDYSLMGDKKFKLNLQDNLDRGQGFQPPPQGQQQPASADQSGTGGEEHHIANKKSFTAEKGQMGVPNDLYEAFGVMQEPKWKRELGDFLKVVIPSIAGGISGMGTEAGWRGGAAAGTLAGWNDVMKSNEDEDTLMAARKMKVLENPELVSSYYQAKKAQGGEGMYPSREKGFGDYLGAALKGNYENTMLRKQLGTGPMGLMLNPNVGGMNIDAALAQMKAMRSAGVNYPQSSEQVESGTNVEGKPFRKKVIKTYGNGKPPPSALSPGSSFIPK